MIVRMYCDSLFRYRLDGSRAWITLTGNEWHDVDFDEGDVVQISSTTNVSHLKIHGHISSVVLENSELTKLDDSFSDTSALESVDITSSSEITSMDDAFNGSSIVNLILPTKDIISANSAFKDTNKLAALSFEPDALKYADNMFDGSKIKSLDRFTDKAIANLDNIFNDAKNFKQVGEIDFSLSNSNKSSIFNLNNKEMSSMDIIVSRGKILLKKYSPKEENEYDDNQSLEIDIEPFVLDVTADGLEYVSDNLDEAFSNDNSLEINIEPYELECTADGLSDIEDGLDRVTDVDANFEIEYKHTNNDIVVATRDDVIVDTGLSTSSDSDNYSLEYDIELINDNIKIAKRDNFHINTGLPEEYDDTTYNLEYDVNLDKRDTFIARRSTVTIDTQLDESFDDTNYTLELDIQGIEGDIDKLDDGSCVFSTGRSLTSDLVSGLAFEAPTDSLPMKTDSIFGERCLFPSGITRTTDGVELSQDVKDWLMKSVYFRVKIPYNSNPYGKWFFEFRGAESYRLILGIYSADGGKYTMRVVGRSEDNGSKHDTNFNTSISNESDAEFSVAIIETDNDDEFNILINGVIEHTYTIPDVTSIEDGGWIKLQTGTHSNNCYMISEFQVFNKTLTQSDILTLDTK